MVLMGFGAGKASAKCATKLTGHLQCGPGSIPGESPPATSPGLTTVTG